MNVYTIMSLPPLSIDVIGNVMAPAYVTCHGNITGYLNGDAKLGNLSVSGDARFFGSQVDIFGETIFEKDVRITADTVIGGSISAKEITSAGILSCLTNFVGNGALLTDLPVPVSVGEKLRALDKRISALEAL